MCRSAHAASEWRASRAIRGNSAARRRTRRVGALAALRVERVSATLHTRFVSKRGANACGLRVGARRRNGAWRPRRVGTLAALRVERVSATLHTRSVSKRGASSVSEEEEEEE